MKCLLSVCLVAFSVAAVSLRSVVVQSSTEVLSAAKSAAAQAMQKGVSVQMASTSSATAMPDADNEDAKIVAVTGDGSIYFGVDPITLTDLTEKVRSTPFRRGQKLYIKADARTTYGRVLRVLESTDIGEIAPPVLLTAQSQPSAPGTVVPPKGFEVLLDPPPGTQPIVVQLVDRGQSEPELEIGGQTVSYAALPDTLRQRLQNTNEKIVRVKAEERLPFAEVVRLIDVCRAAGAKVVLGSPGVEIGNQPAVTMVTGVPRMSLRFGQRFADNALMDPSAIALQGLQQADFQLNAAASAIANAGAATPDSASLDVVDLSAEMVALMSAQNQFAANLDTLKTVDQMQKALVDIKG